MPPSPFPRTPNNVRRRSRQPRRSAFTLVELLIIIAIIAVLAAILFPMFTRSRAKSHQVTCLSNQRQVGLGVFSYLQDFDSTYPGSFNGQAVQWYNVVLPYIKSGETYNSQSYGRGGVFACPEFPKLDYGQGQNYGANDDLFVNNNDINDPSQIHKPYKDSIVASPADTILLTEKGRNGDSWSFPTFLTLQDWWAESVMTEGVYDPAKDNSRISVQPDHDRDLTKPDTNWEGPRTIRYRHMDAANVVFADGHAKSMPKGSIKWYKNVYVKGAHEDNLKYQYKWATKEPK